MDEQLKEWIKDVDDKCEYSDETIDVQTFTDMLSSYFVDYRILLYEKEKKVRDSKSLEDISFYLGNDVEISFDYPKSNFTVTYDKYKKTLNYRHEGMSAFKAKAFLVANSKFINRSMTVLRNVDSMLKSDMALYRLEELEQEVVYGDIKIVFNIIGQYAVYFKDRNITREKNVINYVDNILSNIRINVSDLKPEFKKLYFEFDEMLGEKEYKYK